MRPRFSIATSRGFLLLGLLWLESCRGQYVFNQIAGNIPFDYSTPQVIAPANLNDTVSTKQYSLWGWFRPHVSVVAISNIVQLQNVQGTNRTDVFYLNFIFNGLNATSKVNTYSLMFLNAVGWDSASGNPNMLVTGFENLPFTNNSWVFWAVSCDYQAGSPSIYMNDPGLGAGTSRTFSISFSDFNLRAGFNLVVGSVMNNTYFVSTSGFVGDIGFIDLGLFYTTSFQNLWMGFMTLDTYASLGLIVDLNFIVYNGSTGATVNSTGMNTQSFVLNGNYRAAYLADPRQCSVSFFNSGWVNLGYLDLHAVEGIYSMAMYFNFAYQEPLADTHILFERGVAGAAGYLQIALVKSTASSARLLQLTVQGTKQTVWKGQMQFFAGSIYRMISGITVNPRGDIYNVFFEEESRNSDFSLLAAQEQFIPAAMQTVLLNQKNGATSSNTGNFTLYRFSVLSSASSALSAALASQFTTSNSTAAADYQKCALKTTFFGDARGCLVATSGMTLVPSYTPVTYCPFGSKNATTDICVPCLYSNCSDIVSTGFTVSPLADNAYRIQSTIPVNDFAGLMDRTKISVANVSSSTFYNYTVTPNAVGQYADVVFNIQGDVTNGYLLFNYTPAASGSASPIYDRHANIVPAFLSKYTLPDFCYLTDATKSAMKGLAWTAIALFFLSALILILLSLFCWAKLSDAGALWKQLVHIIIRTQLVACLVLLGVKLPCSLKEFLTPLYLIFVSWAHGLGWSINRIYSDSSSYQTGYVQNPTPTAFASQGAYNFFLHNMVIAFIIHGTVFVIYILLKLFGCCTFRKSAFFYRFLVFLEFSGMIGWFGVTLVIAGVFSFLNFRLTVWTHAYFVFSFLFAVAYLAVFVFFGIYVFYRLVVTRRYLSDPTLFNALYYYSSGYKKGPAARTYDLWFYLVYFVCGAALGALYDVGLAEMIIILVALLILFLLTVLLRPARFLLQNLLDIFTQVVLLVVIVMLLALAIYDLQGCTSCPTRNGSFGLALVSLLFVYLVLQILGFIFQTFAHLFAYDWYNRLGKTNHEMEEGAAGVALDGQVVANLSHLRSIDHQVTESNQHVLVNDFKSFKDSSKAYLATSTHQPGQIRIEEAAATLRDDDVDAFQATWEKNQLPQPAPQMAQDSTLEYHLAYYPHPFEESKEERVANLTFDEELTHRTHNGDEQVFLAHHDNRRQQMKHMDDDSYISIPEIKHMPPPSQPFR